jgi:ATP-dependent helicase/DNAse subunit B
MRTYRPSGVFDQRIASALDAELGPAVSPVANMRLKKDGGYWSNCDARPGPEITSRLDLARRTIVQTARGIIDGSVDVAPLVEGRRLACATCAYQSICRFDPAFNRPRAAERVLPVLPTPTEIDAECE